MNTAFDQSKSTGHLILESNYRHHLSKLERLKFTPPTVFRRTKSPMDKLLRLSHKNHRLACSYRQLEQMAKVREDKRRLQKYVRDLSTTKTVLCKTQESTQRRGGGDGRVKLPPFDVLLENSILCEKIQNVSSEYSKKMFKESYEKFQNFSGLRKKNNVHNRLTKLYQ